MKLVKTSAIALAISAMVAGPVLAHRLSLARQTSDALEERRTVAAALRRIVAAVAVPE